MQDNLSLYHIFYTVARTGSISHSSRDLYISQPAISKAIQKLEQNLDTVLFKRSSRGVTLTPDGELLFEKVKEALSLLDEGENSIRHNRSRDIPKLRLGASSTLTRYVLLSHLENYIARFPHVRITISCQSTYQTLQLLDEEKIDLGLIGRPQKLRGYYFQPLLKIQDTFVCTQQYLENQKKLYPDEPLIQAATFMMPKLPAKIGTKITYWYGDDEKKDRRRDIRFIKGYFPQTRIHGIPKMAHAELVMVHPEKFCRYAEKFLTLQAEEV